MTTVITIRLPFLLPTRNQQDRMHFHEKTELKAPILREFMTAGIRSGGAPMKYAEVTVWRHSIREPDRDGNMGSIKQLLDLLQPEGKLRKMKGALAFPNPGGMGIIMNDSPAHAVVRALWLKAPSLAGQHTMVRIKRLDAMPVPESASEAAE
jgi:hypothetical protein